MCVYAGVCVCATVFVVLFLSSPCASMASYL